MDTSKEKEIREAMLAIFKDEENSYMEKFPHEYSMTRHYMMKVFETKTPDSKLDHASGLPRLLSEQDGFQKTKLCKLVYQYLDIIES